MVTLFVVRVLKILLSSNVISHDLVMLEFVVLHLLL